MDFLKEKIKVSLREINKYRKEWSAPVKGFKYFDCEPKTNNVLPSPEDPRFKDFVGEVWDIGPDSHQWFYKRIVIPDGAKGKKIRFQLQTGTSGWNVNNPQFIAYIDGKMVQGLDINHTSLPVGSKTEFDLHLYAYSGAQPKNLRFCPSVYVTDELCEKVYYDITVPYELLDCLSPISKEYADIIEHLDRALNKIDFRQAPGGNFVRSLEAASEYMDTEFYGKYCDIKQDRSVVAFGHTHIDCAWKWTLAQSREKVQRSFSNVMTNMAEYPDYKFMQSQPLLYRYTKEEAPELYEQIKEKVKEGRWECEGAMYVEADCNLPSGESFVRQLIYGKGFFRREFGKESKVFWVPDVFGYSAALPQILKKSGVDYFVTSKLSWNEKNRYPYDIFRWRGIDGTEVNGYFLTSQEKERSEEYRNRTNYNAKMSPKYAVGTFDRLQQKTLTDEVLLPFGYGDGGGGPTREHLEHMKRLSKGIRCCPVVKSGFLKDYLEKLFSANENNDRMPTWEGELYFELHRGTLTSVAKVKKNNRVSEFLWQNVEQMATALHNLLGEEYPKDIIDDAWITILTNQFHDVIPGSSIEEVYAVSDADFARIIGGGKALEDKMFRLIADNITTDGGVLVYNPHSAVNSGNVKVNGKTVYVGNIAPKGWCVVKPAEIKGSVSVADKRMENDFFVVEFNDDYIINRIYDKKNDREVLKAGGLGNRLVAYEDYPRDYDAWEITEYYTEKHWDIDGVSGVEFINDGARSGIKIDRSFLSSTLSQCIWMYENTPKIDFETEADWHEDHILVKTLFDTDIHASRATYNIQFGNLERPTTRNTSWDTARFEVCAHKFADLSEGAYGVTLMNDCKYGYGINDGVIGLSLIKCATDPNPVADQGRHSFTYSLYPHADILERSDAVALSYELNKPLMAMEIGANKGTLPERFSFVSTDCSNVIVETVKKAEESDATIIRLYESTNSRTRTTVKFGIPVKSVALCDLQENELERLDAEDGSVILTVKPYEIVTLKIN